MISNKSSKIITVGIISFAVVALIGIIYAAFTGQLNVTGTGVGRNSKWDIHFENVSNITTNGTAKVLDNHQPVINSNNLTQIEDYKVSLTSPGDTLSFTFDVVNSGNYNAKISNLNVGTPRCTSTDTASAVNMCNNLKYTITYDNGAIINTGDVVYANDYITLKVTLTFNDISDASLLPVAQVSINNLDIEISFEQFGKAGVSNQTGEVVNYGLYRIGDKITLNNEDYYVIKKSGGADDYVTAIKSTPLTQEEINLYKGNDTSVSESKIKYGDTRDYDDSQAKIVVDNWTAETFSNDDLKEVDSYYSRLITLEEYLNIPTQYTWRYDSNYSYWTMTGALANPYWKAVEIIKSDGQNINSFGNSSYNSIRPVINVYKTSLND